MSYIELKCDIDEMLKGLSCVPDVWMLCDNELIVVEVFNTSPLSHIRMGKYAWLDEHLYNVHGNDLRIVLYEVHLNTGKRVIKHNVGLFHEMIEFEYSYNKETLREYHNRLSLSQSMIMN